jgi:hypothetical protein
MVEDDVRQAPCPQFLSDASKGGGHLGAANARKSCDQVANQAFPLEPRLRQALEEREGRERGDAQLRIHLHHVEEAVNAVADLSQEFGIAQRVHVESHEVADVPTDLGEELLEIPTGSALAECALEEEG